jgi:hypothetical protein
MFFHAVDLWSKLAFEDHLRQKEFLFFSGLGRFA